MGAAGEREQLRQTGLAPCELVCADRRVKPTCVAGWLLLWDRLVF